MDTSTTRRRFLSLAAALGAGAFLPPADVRAAGPEAKRRPACILLWMNGGPSHLDTWDPKVGPVAGPTRSIASRVPGVTLSEHLPRLAERADRLAIVRGMTSREGSHDRAQSLVHTGHVPNPSVDAPAFGAWVARERGRDEASLPPYVALGGPTVGAGFLGRSYDPLVVARPGAPPDHLTPNALVGPARFARRERLLGALETDLARRTGQASVPARTAVHERAVRLATSADARLFDLSGEPASDKDRYGDSDFGRGCLVARRLVEAGVPFVEVVLDGWDTHKDNFARVASLCGALDPAMSALLDDLRARGLDRDVTVAWMGEFGRTPRISGDEGRDHHPAAWSAVLAGAGIRGGVVHGETDAEGARVVRDATSVADLHATIAAATGLDPALTRMTPEGRPFSITDGGRPIPALLAR